MYVQLTFRVYGVALVIDSAFPSCHVEFLSVKFTVHRSKFASSLTRSSHGDFVLTVYGQISQVIELKQVDVSESTDINQSIPVNRFYPIEALIFIQ